MNIILTTNFFNYCMLIEFQEKKVCRSAIKLFSYILHLVRKYTYTKKIFFLQLTTLLVKNVLLASFLLLYLYYSQNIVEEIDQLQQINYVDNIVSTFSFISIKLMSEFCRKDSILLIFKASFDFKLASQHFKSISTLVFCCSKK